MGISIWQLAIIAIIVALLFGTKRLSTLGSDIGTTVKGFKSAMKDAPETENNNSNDNNESNVSVQK